MIQSILKTLSAEWALHKHNKLNKHGVFDCDAQKFYVVPNALPDHTYREALSDLEQFKNEWVRSNTPWRRGSAIRGHELRKTCSGEWLEYLQSRRFIAKVREATGLKSLEYVQPIEFAVFATHSPEFVSRQKENLSRELCCSIPP